MKQEFKDFPGSDINNLLELSDGQIGEHAYLIDRGTRPMTLFNSFPNEAFLMARMLTRLEVCSIGFPNAIAFVIDEEHFASCGFASHKWVIDLFVYASKLEEPHRSRILGLLFGYSNEAIAKWEDTESVKLFNGIESDECQITRD